MKEPPKNFISGFPLILKSRTLDKLRSMGTSTTFIPTFMLCFIPSSLKYLELFVPLFERVLGDLQNLGYRRFERFHFYTWDPEREEGVNEYDEQFAYRTLVVPSPGVFSIPIPPTRPTFELKGRTVQVIVKVADTI